MKSILAAIVLAVSMQANASEVVCGRMLVIDIPISGWPTGPTYTLMRDNQQWLELIENGAGPTISELVNGQDVCVVGNLLSDNKRFWVEGLAN